MDLKDKEQLKRLLFVGVGIGTVGILILAIILSKVLFGEGVMCTLYELTGYYCPGCGGTRMALALLRLDIYQAFRYNPYILGTLPFVVVIALKQFYIFIRYNKMLDKLDTYLIVYAFGLVIFGVVRNIPIFSFLAPTVIY